MSLTADELKLLQDLAANVQTLRSEVHGWQQRAYTLEQQNAQLSQQIEALNKSNAGLGAWQTQVANAINGLVESRQDYDKQLTDLCGQLAAQLKRL